MKGAKRMLAVMVILVWAIGFGRPGLCHGQERKDGRYKSRMIRDLVRQMRPGGGVNGTTGATEQSRDPFAVTDTLVSKIKRENKTEGREALEFLPSLNPAGIPKLKLRGHLNNGSRGAVALLEIQGGGVYIVREGDTVGLHDLGYDSVIRIQKIDRLHLVVESGSLGKVIIVR